MVDFIEEIYRFAQLIPEMKKIIYMCKKNDNVGVGLCWDDYSECFAEFCNLLINTDEQLARELWNYVEKACAHTRDENSSYMLMADELERGIPSMYKAMEFFGKIDVTEGNYRLTSSDSGFLTLQNVISGDYIHSSLDPMDEARIIAQGIYTTSQQNCRIVGCGLGYLAYELFKMSHGRFDVYVYETDNQLIQYAYEYGVLSLIPEDKLHVIVEKDAEILFEKIMDDADEGMGGKTAYFCYNDLIERVPENVKEALQKLQILITTYYNLKDQSDSNFNRNILNISKTVYDLDMKADNKDWIVVGGGPSVDEQLEYIRGNQGIKNIIVASTVYKKMVKEGIKPDYVAVTDPQNRTYGHMENVTDYSAKLLVNAVANWQFAEYYKGDKYIVPCSGHETVTKYCGVRGIEMIEVGSTVPAMCINVALRLGARRIELIGLDLSYPSSASHASGTMDYEELDRSGYPEVPSVDGGMVKSKGEFIYYIQEIEDIINRNSRIEFINYSSKGALIKGAKWFKEVNTGE